MIKKLLRKKATLPKQGASSSLLSRVFQFVFAAVGGLVFVSLLFFLSSFFRPSFCANSKSCIQNLAAQVDNNTDGFFAGQKIVPPKIDLASAPSKSIVLGDTSLSGEKHIYVDLAQQRLYAFQGSTVILDTLISSGKWHLTPPGDYHIWVKVRSTRMSGGSGSDAYDLPNVPYVMFFYNDQVPKAQGFSLHGAYWHNNFGHMMSHGCVNMRTVDAQVLYDWADPVTEGSTTYANADSPGTVVSVCQRVQIQDGASPLCIE